MNKNLTAAVLIVLAIGIYFTVTEGVLAQANNVKAVNDQYVSAIATAEKLVAVRDQVLNDYKNLSDDDRLRLAKMVPSSVDNIRLIIDLNSVALQHGFILNGVTATAAPEPISPTAQPQTTPQGVPMSLRQGQVVGANSGGLPVQNIAAPVLDTVDVSFTVNAPYLEFIRFMQDLEANLRIMDITHLSITAADSGNYSFQVQLRTYWLRQQ